MIYMIKEKSRLITSRSYYLMSCYRYYNFKGNKKYEQSVILHLENNGGQINFEFVKPNGEVIKLDNPKTGIYEFPLEKGQISKLVIKATSAKGGYRIHKKTIKIKE